LHLNIWADNYLSWFDTQLFLNNTEPFPNVHGVECFGGLDLAAVSDFNSLALLWVFPDGKAYIRNWYWIPADSLDKRIKAMPQIQTWEMEGWLQRTAGNVVDDRLLVQEIVEVLTRYNVNSIAYDKALAHSGIAQDLIRNGFELYPQSQGIMSMSGPTKTYEKWTRNGRMKNDGNPITRWMIENTRIYADANDNEKPIKNKSVEKIDGVVAGIMAVGQYLFMEAKNPTSVYADTDLI
jgi:phage terminase large subunit-like protein